MGPRKVTTSIMGVFLAVLLTEPVAAATQPHTILGTITGSINATPVNMSAFITFDYTQGLEVASVSNVPASLGSSLRAYTSLVTLAGPTGGVGANGAKNLLTLSGDNFTNVTFQFYGTDTLRSTSNFSWNGISDTASYSMTVSGKVLAIASGSSVQINDFVELLTAGTGPGTGVQDVQATQSINTSGGRGILIGGGPGPGGGKGSVTSYNGSPLPFPENRFGSGFTSTFNSGTSTLQISGFNSMQPAVTTPAATRPVTLALALILGSVALIGLRRRTGRAV